MKTWGRFNAYCAIFLLTFFNLCHYVGVADAVFADTFSEISPYSKTFTISAYYSPCPAQAKYATGSYAGDIRLNGNGTNGADGTPVYAGMIAAPKSYAFGTKLDIPGIGVSTVHDRGGAIVDAGLRSNVYDRLDIWMGYGDKGLQRALQWGKRDVNVTIYGVNDSIVETAGFGDYTSAENCSNSVFGVLAEGNDVVVPQPVVTPKPLPVAAAAPSDNLGRLAENLKKGDSGEAVRKLQEELKRLNLFKENITSYYGDVTEHAVLKFQQSQSLVWDENSEGAGIFGAKTRDRLNEIIAGRGYSGRLIAEATEKHEEILLARAELPKSESKEIQSFLLTNELQFGMVEPQVADLQRFLKKQGHFKGALITNYFGKTTQQAVLDFQIAQGVVSSHEDLGAGRVGPATLAKIKELSA